MKLIIALLFSGIIFFFSALNWRHTIKAIFILLVFEGALRKWVLPQASELVYFLKDIVLLGAYFNFYVFSSYPKNYINPKYIVNLLIFLAIGWCIFQVFNPSLGSPFIGILGLRGYLLYLPLIWMLPFLFDSEEELYKFLKVHLLLLIPVGLLGIVQFFSPASSFINSYATEEIPQVATFGVSAAVRVTGTFSYISGYGLYLTVCFGLLIPFFSVSQKGGWTVIFLTEFLLVIVNSLMTGSRGVILAEILFIVGYIFIKGLRQLGSTVRFLKRLFVPSLVVAIAALIWFRPAVDAFWLRTTSNQDVGGRITGSFTEPFDFMKFKGLDGYGTGATHQAAPVLRAALDLPAGEVIPVYFEPEMGRIALELGPIGFLFWYGLRIYLTVLLFITYWKLKRPFLRQLALAAFLIQAIQISGTLVFHHTFSIYYWFLGSFIFLLPRLEEIENWQQEQQLQQDVLFTYLSDSSYGES